MGEMLPFMLERLDEQSLDDLSLSPSDKAKISHGSGGRVLDPHLRRRLSACSVPRSTGSNARLHLLCVLAGSRDPLAFSPILPKRVAEGCGLRWSIREYADVAAAAGSFRRSVRSPAGPQALRPNRIRACSWLFPLLSGASPLAWLFNSPMGRYVISGLFCVGAPFDESPLQIPWSANAPVDARIASAAIGLGSRVWTAVMAGLHRIGLGPVLLLPFFAASLRIRHGWGELSPKKTGTGIGTGLLLASTVVGLGIMFGVLRFDAPWESHRTETSDEAPVKSMLDSLWDWRTRSSDQAEVVVVGSAKKDAQVRAAVRHGEVIAETPGAFAHRRHQIVAPS